MIPDGTPLPHVDDPVTQYAPTARPGSRAPHVWLARGGARISTIDLFGPRFVLLAGRDGGCWMEAARRVGPPARPPLIAHIIGDRGELRDVDGACHDAYGIDGGGAVLVRPDGHVGWRSRTAPADPERALAAALDAILGRGPRVAAGTVPDEGRPAR